MTPSCKEESTRKIMLLAQIEEESEWSVVLQSKEMTRFCHTTLNKEKAKAWLPHPAKKRQMNRSRLPVLTREKA